MCVCSDYFTVTTDGELCLKPGTMGLQKLLVFDVKGTFQFTKADYPWLARIKVQVQGAGGGSAGANAADSEALARPGGAGGGWSMSLIEVASLGAVETIVVGAGGAGGVGNATGSGGGNSSFGGSVIAPGGDGGSASMTTGSTPDAVSGVVGPTAGTGDQVSGGGNSGGAIRLSGVKALSGAGGDSQLGQGGGARASEGGGTASRGRGAGAGGSVSFGASVDGVAGGDGLVVIELYG